MLINIRKIRAHVTRGVCAAIFDYVVAPHLFDVFDITDEANIATVNNDLNTIKYLVSIDAKSRWISDTFYLAASRGCLNIVKYLVSVGAKVHIYEDGAFRSAAANGKLDMLKYLVSVGANVHACNNYALRWATANGYKDVVEYLNAFE